MLHCIARKTVVALGLMCGLCRGQQNVPDSATYAFFFGKVAQFKSGVTIFLNGQDTGLNQPSLQQAMGLTDGETEILHNLAVACAAKIRTLDETVQPFIFEARLRSIDSAEPERVRLRQRLNDIENHRSQIVQACVNELRVEFGESRFEVMQLYVGSRKIADLFPPISTKPTTQQPHN